MRKFGLFLCLSLLFAFTGCSDSDDVEEQGGTVLAKPSVAVTTTTSSSFKVAWDAVPNAESYKYRLSQENETGDELVVQPENSTSATALAFGDLDPKTKYILRVKAVAAAGSGLTDSEYSKIFATTLAEEAAELTFEKIAATNPTYESVDVEIVPSAENLYYWQVVENSLIEGKSDREIVAALKENISELSSGTVRKTVHGLKADTEYTVVAFGYDLDAGKSTSAVARLETAFTTPADDRMTIAITVGTVTAENAHVTFAPSTANADYFADVVVAADIAGKTEMEIVALLQTKYGDEMDEIARKGDYEGDFAVEAGKEYTAVAFAYDAATSELTTKLASETFSAPLVDGNSIFTMTMSNPTESTFDYTITSSDPDMYYMPLSLATKLLPQFDADKEVSLVLQQINQLIGQYGFEMVAKQLFYKGTSSGTFPDLDPETEYVLLTFGIAQVSETEVKACTTLAQSEDTITTLKAEAPATDTWVNMRPVNASDTRGIIMGTIFYPNAATSEIIGFASALTGDATSLEQIGMTEATMRSKVLAEGEVIQQEEGGYSLGYYVDASQPWIFATVGKNAEGKAGNVNWIICKAPATADGQLAVLGQSINNDPTGGGGDATDAYKKYLGTWTVTSTSSVLTKKPLTFDITIEQNVANKSFYVSGWAISTLRNEYKLPWSYNAENDIISSLTVSVGSFEDDTYGNVSVEYQPYCYWYSDQDYFPLRFDVGNALMGGQITNDQFTIVGLTEQEVSLSGGSKEKIDVVFMDYYGYCTYQGQPTLLTYRAAEGFTQDDYPIGPFKLTKSAAKGVGSAAVKNTRMTSDAVSVFNGNFRQVSSSILGRIDYMPKSVVKKLAQEVNRTWLPTEISRFQGLPLGIETAATSVHLNLHKK